MPAKNLDAFDLQRFVEAQDAVWPAVLSELKAGAKRTHWMWFVFPQIAGLGRSPMAHHYAISGREEAEAYLAHPILGPRLEATTTRAMRHSDKPLDSFFGSPDDLKFRSSVTLFAEVAEPGSLYARALAIWNLHPDEATLDLLNRSLLASTSRET